MRMKRLIHEQKGSAFVLALIALAAGAILASAFLSMANSSLKISHRFDDSAKRTYAAEAGMEYAIWGLQTRSISAVELPITETGMSVNNCDVTITITEKIPDLGGEPKNSMFYTITSTATDDIGKETTITADVSTAFDIWSYALLSLDGNIDITGDDLASWGCGTNQASNPYIFGTPNASIDEADIFANGGDITIAQRNASTYPQIRGDAIATGSIGGSGVSHIDGTETENAVHNLPAIINQKNQMDDSIKEWRAATIIEPATPPAITAIEAICDLNTPVTVDAVPCGGTMRPATTIAATMFGGRFFTYGQSCWSGNVSAILAWAKRASVTFNGEQFINGSLTVTTSDVVFNGPLYVNGNITLQGIASTATFNDMVHCTGRIQVNIGSRATFNDSLHCEGDLNIITSTVSFVDASANKNITGIADAGGGDIEVTTSAAHGLSVSDSVLILETCNYNGEYVVQSAPTATTFTVTAAFVEDETGFMDECETVVIGGDLDVDVALAATFRTQLPVRVDGNAEFNVTVGGLTLDFEDTLEVGGSLSATAGGVAAVAATFEDAVQVGQGGVGNLTLTGAWLAVCTANFQGTVHVENNLALASALGGVVATFGNDASDTTWVGNNVTLTSAVAGITSTWNGQLYIGNNFTMGGGAAVVFSTVEEDTWIQGDLDCQAMFGGSQVQFGDDDDAVYDDYLYVGGDSYFSGSWLGAQWTRVYGPFVSYGDMALAGGGIGIGTLQFYDDVYNAGSMTSNALAGAVFSMQFGTDASNVFYCGSDFDISGALVAGSTMTWASDSVYIGGHFAITGGVFAASGVNFIGDFYAGDYVTVGGVGAWCTLSFGDEEGDTMFCGGDLTVSGIVALSTVDFWDIAYCGGDVDISGAFNYTSCEFHRMIVAEGNMSLDSTNTGNSALSVEFIPLFISSGSVPGKGNIELKQYFDTPGVFYAPKGTISLTGYDNDIFGSMIGESISIDDDCFGFAATNSSVMFPADIRKRASDLPGRTSGEEGTDVYGWQSSG